MIKGLVTAVIVSAIVLLIGGGALWVITRNTSMLNPKLIDVAQRASASGASGLSAPSGLGGAAETGSLDGAASTTQASDSSTRLDTEREEASKTAFTWLASSVLFATVCAAFWMIVALGKGAKAASPSMQRGALKAWGGYFLLLIVLLGGGAYFILAKQAYFAKVSAGTLQLTILIVSVASIGAYYLGTALGISRLMLPSVPLATAWRRR